MCKLPMSLLSPKGEIVPISYVLLPPPTPGNCWFQARLMAAGECELWEGKESLFFSTLLNATMLGG